MAPTKNELAEWRRPPEPYENVDLFDLKAMCRHRGLDNTGNKRTCIKLLVERDRKRFYENIPTYNEENDPTGSKALQQIEDTAKFEEMCERSLFLPQIQYLEGLVDAKKAELDSKISEVAANKKTELLKHAKTVKALSDKKAKSAAALANGGHIKRYDTSS